MKNKIIINNKITIKSVAEASISNPFIKEVSFILTDDKPNANFVGIRKEDFFSLAQSAIWMPIKMAPGQIAEGHDGATPLGVITETTIEEACISGVGVIWPEERPSDVSFLTEKTEHAEAFLSWEIAYEQMDIDEDGIGWLKNPILLATTLVSRPAYGERTRVLEVSSKDGIMKNEEELSETTQDILESPEVETEVEIEEPTEEPEENPVVEETEDYTDVEYKKMLEELEALREYKDQVETEKIFNEAKLNVINDLKDVIELPEDDLNIIAKFDKNQYDVFKKYVSAKAAKIETSSEDVEVVPEFILTTGDNSPLSTLKAYMNKNRS